MASFSSTLSAQKKVDPTGTWTFLAEEAPSQYNSGDFVIAEDGGKYTAKIVYGEYSEYKGSNVKYENNEINFTVNIEGESIPIKGTVGKDTIEGTASSSEGSISFTAKKKK